MNAVAVTRHPRLQIPAGPAQGQAAPLPREEGNRPQELSFPSPSSPCLVLLLGDDRGWPQQRVWLCVFFLSRRGNEGRHRDERVHPGHEAAVRGAGPAQRGTEGHLDQPVHAAALLGHAGPGRPPLGLLPAACQLLPAHRAPGEGLPETPTARRRKQRASQADRGSQPAPARNSRWFSPVSKRADSVAVQPCLPMGDSSVKFKFGDDCSKQRKPRFLDHLCCSTLMCQYVF